MKTIFIAFCIGLFCAFVGYQLGKATPCTEVEQTDIFKVQP